MDIDIAGPMLVAQRENDDTYTPIVDGQPLELECNSTKITVKNLNTLMEMPVGSKKLRRSVVSIYAVEGNILVVFDTGESYLATGFRLGSNEDETVQLALFAAKHLAPGKDVKIVAKRLKSWYCQLDPDFTGRLPIDEKFPASHADDESGIISTADTQTLPIRAH